MPASSTGQNGAVHHWIAVRPEPLGCFTVQVVGLPELSATAATREEAVQQVRTMLGEWLASGRLAPIEIQATNPLLDFRGHLDPNDPLEQAFVEELARLHREDVESALREDDGECSSSSSTPTI
jgi:predicted RNase H-like HicB family nuclease